MSVSGVKRIQGRPIRGDGDVGREKLVEAARAIMRTAAPPEISRKAVADAAGVTPALVSYYFPDKNSLVSAATRPLVGQRIGQLLAVLEAPGSPHDRLRQIVSLLVRLNENESHLIDYTIEFCRQDAADDTQRSMLTDAYQRLRDFYLDGVSAGAWRRLHPDLFLFALWGMCKSVAQTHGMAEGDDEVSASAAQPEPRVAMIVDLALNGLRER